MARKTFQSVARNELKTASGSARKSVFISGTLVVAVTFGAWYFFRQSAVNEPLPAPTETETSITMEDSPPRPPMSFPATDPGNQVVPETSADASSVSDATASSGAQSRAVTPEPLQQPASVPASAYSRALVDYLAGIDLRQGSISPAQASLWKQGLDRLVQEGAQAVPAIREFLAREVDVDYASVQNGGLLGTTSLRSAMFDALRQIGGPESISLALEVMQTTTRPDEIARLARDLDAAAPEQYRDAAITAARTALARTTPNSALPPVDTSPLFEVLQKFGDANIIPDLELASTKWNYYGPIVLASLPEGAGVPTLARIAQNSDPAFSSSSQFALRLLAELSSQDPNAAQALLDQAGKNQIPNSAWMGIAAALGGEQSFYPQKYLSSAAPPANAADLKTYHIKANNQNFASVNVSRTWSPEQLSRQFDLIDRLRATSPVAGTMLEAVRHNLAAKSGQ